MLWTDLISPRGSACTAAHMRVHAGFHALSPTLLLCVIASGTVVLTIGGASPSKAVQKARSPRWELLPASLVPPLHLRGGDSTDTTNADPQPGDDKVLYSWHGKRLYLHYRNKEPVRPPRRACQSSRPVAAVISVERPASLSSSLRLFSQHDGCILAPSLPGAHTRPTPHPMARTASCLFEQDYRGWARQP